MSTKIIKIPCVEPTDCALYGLVFYNEVAHKWQLVEDSIASNYSPVWKEKGIFALWTEKNRYSLYRETKDGELAKITCTTYLKFGENLFFKIGAKWYRWNTDKDICDYCEVTQLGDFPVFIGRGDDGKQYIFAEEIVCLSGSQKITDCNSVYISKCKVPKNASDREEMKGLPMSEDGKYVISPSLGRTVFYDIAYVGYNLKHAVNVVAYEGNDNKMTYEVQLSDLFISQLRGIYCDVKKLCQGCRPEPPITLEDIVQAFKEKKALVIAKYSLSSVSKPFLRFVVDLSKPTTIRLEVDAEVIGNKIPEYFDSVRIGKNNMIEIIYTENEETKTVILIPDYNPITGTHCVLCM